MENFIRIWDNALDENLCDNIIQIFEEKYNTNCNSIIDERSFISTMKDYLSCFLQEDNKETQKQIWDNVSFYLEKYIHEFGQLKQVPLIFSAIKLKKINPYGGYHSWHYENAGFDDNPPRELVWMIYLNDMPQNEAETEFLYQKLKVQPKKGRLVIFPASLTHVHRGLTVYSHPKYIISGWLYRNYDVIKNQKLESLNNV